MDTTTLMMRWYDGVGSYKADPRFQYAYARSALYCLIDRNTLDLAGWNSFDVSDGDISAPECIPTGSVHGSDKHGSCWFKNFTTRGIETVEVNSRNALASKLIDELLAELQQTH